MSDERCFFAGLPETGLCDGRLIRAHIVPRSLLKSTFYYGVVFEDGAWRKLGRTEDRYELEHRSLRDLVDDERSWVPCCGGAVGLSGHHGRVDGLRMVVPREALPAGVEEYAAELGLSWYLDRRFGPVDESRAA